MTTQETKELTNAEFVEKYNKRSLSFRHSGWGNEALDRLEKADNDRLKHSADIIGKDMMIEMLSTDLKKAEVEILRQRNKIRELDGVAEDKHIELSHYKDFLKEAEARIKELEEIIKNKEQEIFYLTNICDDKENNLDYHIELEKIIKKEVDRQSEDKGLWFNTETASEAYLQQELRKLHQLIERELILHRCK